MEERKFKAGGKIISLLSGKGKNSAGRDELDNETRTPQK
jgi:hypothetical protein